MKTLGLRNGPLNVSVCVSSRISARTFRLPSSSSLIAQEVNERDGELVTSGPKESPMSSAHIWIRISVDKFRH